MKLIHNFKSPNFNDRKSNNIEIIVIHYTALSSISNSLKHLCSKKNKVSSHYLISQEGKIYSLVSDKKRAWHAGQSYWRGNTDINSISIGIELDFSPSDINNKVKAFLKYKSQVKKFPHPRSKESIVNLSKVRGSQVFMKYAEAFKIEKILD